MRDDEPAKPHLTDAGAQAAEQRRRRQASALRANLARRKTRDRAAATAAQAPGPAAGPLERQDESAPVARTKGGA